MLVFVFFYYTCPELFRSQIFLVSLEPRWVNIPFSITYSYSLLTLFPSPSKLLLFLIFLIVKFLEQSLSRCLFDLLLPVSDSSENLLAKFTWDFPFPKLLKVYFSMAFDVIGQLILSEGFTTFHIISPFWTPWPTVNLSFPFRKKV